MATKGAKNYFFKNGLFTGYGDYRYGAPKKPVKLAPIFTGAKREHRLGEVIDLLKDWRFSEFEHEGDCRAGLRSGLCAQGYAWSRSDAEAMSLVDHGLRRVGAKRPTWLEGQREYVVPREICSWCGADVPEELLKDGLSIKFCGEVCAKSAIQHRDHEECRGKGKLYQAAINVIKRTGNKRCLCDHCGDPFQPIKDGARYCSTRCSGSSFRYLADRECQHCGKGFRPKDASKKHCSKACSDLAKRENPDRFCKQCGILFRRTNRTGHDAQFCSRPCFVESKRVNVRKHCAWCEKVFTAQNVQKKYCCTTCSLNTARIIKGTWVPKVLTAPVFDHYFTKPLNGAYAQARSGMRDIDRGECLTAEIFDSWFERAA